MRVATRVEVAEHVQNFRGSCISYDEAVTAIRVGDVRSRLGVRPIGVELDLTNQCNIRCVMCYFSDPAIGRRPRRDLEDNTYARLAEEMFPWLRSLGLMFGTEPILNHRLVDFVRIAKGRRIPKVYFSTNGVRLTAQLSEALMDAGLDVLNVSMDAGTKEKFERVRRGAKCNNVIGNLRSLHDLKATRRTDLPRLGLSFVLMRSTLHEVPMFTELAAELGAEVIHLLHMVPYDNLDNSGESLVHEPESCDEVLEAASSLAVSLGLQIRRPAPMQTSAPSTASEPSPNRIDLARARHTFDLALSGEDDPSRTLPGLHHHFVRVLFS
jgi:molybdenum cofactor biosynthesis enzyme MoaA